MCVVYSTYNWVNLLASVLCAMEYSEHKSNLILRLIINPSLSSLLKFKSTFQSICKIQVPIRRSSPNPLKTNALYTIYFQLYRIYLILCNHAFCSLFAFRTWTGCVCVCVCVCACVCVCVFVCVCVSVCVFALFVLFNRLY